MIKNYEVHEISHRMAKNFIEKYHYAGGTSVTSSLRFGLFDRTNLIGTCLWMTSTYGTAKLYDQNNISKVLTLSRFVLSPGNVKNTCSYFLGSCIRKIKKKNIYTYLVTYADTSQGHIGTIYRATNWIYHGLTEPHYAWIDTEGKLVSKKSTINRTNAYMDKNYTRVGPYRKHRFYLKLNPKNKNKQLNLFPTVKN
tara:strand:+ start:265 stop:852 length:588 start_codon:yes stop_codon:yes gene_type:complete